MTTDRQKPTTQHFVESFDDYCVGLVDLSCMRSIIAELLGSEPGSAEIILVTLDTAFREGLIKASTYDKLTTDVDRVTSEDEPTEWSEETREYIVDNESADNEWSDANLSLTEDTGYPTTELTGSTNTSLPAAAAADLAPGSVLNNRFELVSHIGAGSMADVYEAIDRRQQEAGSADPRVAIKVISRAYSIHPHALKTLQHEALNSQRLIHPNIIRVFDFDRDDERFFMTMELLGGQSLVDRLDERRLQPLPIKQATSIIENMCRGLQYAHQQGVIHADIKPGNIFISTAGQAKILDFGISRIVNNDVANNDIAGDDSPVTGAHTPAYASCEVLEGAEPTEQDDLFSLACVAYRMLAGHRAFDGLTALDAERKHHNPQPVDTLNAQQWQILQQSLALRRADRTASLAAFAAAFSSPAPVIDTPRNESDQQPDRIPGHVPNNPALRGLPLRFGIPAIAVILIAITLALFWPEPEPAPLSQVRIEFLTPDTSREPLNPADSPADDVEQPAADTAGPPLPEPVDSVVSSATPPESPPVASIAPTTIPQPDPVQARIDELTILADDAMSDGRLLDPADDNARLFVMELATLAPETAEVQQRRTRLAELMLLESMVAITDEDFDSATQWISSAKTLGVPEDMTQRFEIELQKARNAKSARQTDTLGSIFASITPAAILAGPGIDFGNEQELATATEAVITNPQAVTGPATGPGSLSLAMILSGALPDVATKGVDEGSAGEPAMMPDPDIPLSALEFKRFVEPKMSRRLSNRRASGWVEVRFRVTTNGSTDNITVLAADPDDRFVQSAITAISKWRFKPVYVDGIATEKYSGVRLRFKP